MGDMMRHDSGEALRQQLARESKPPKYGSMQEAADFYGVSRDSIRRRIADGSLKAYRLGPRAIRVRLDELETIARPIPSAADGNDAA